MNMKRIESTNYGTLGSGNDSRRFYSVTFYRAESGREPVRDWLKTVAPTIRKRIGRDLYTLQLGWPLGMPLARKLNPILWELRSQIPNGIARIIFTEENGALVLLHGFIKKSQKLSKAELALAKKRMAALGVGRKS